MIRDITIGQYYPAQSPIHKLDPRVKTFRNTYIYYCAVFLQGNSRCAVYSCRACRSYKDIKGAL